MNRFLAMFCACLLSFISLASAGLAAPGDTLSFTLSPPRSGSVSIGAEFRRPGSQWGSSFHPREFVGLDLAGFRAEGARPLRFAVIRDAGRLDCEGKGGGQRATGACRFTPDAGFAQEMARLGVGRPTAEHASTLMALGARRDTVAAIAAARYPAPTIDELISLTALGVNPAYVSGLASAGYRVTAIDTLIQFKALGITPGFITGFERVGYARLSADSLVQLKALGVTPEWARTMERRHGARPTVSQLVQMKALGF